MNGSKVQMTGYWMKIEGTTRNAMGSRNIKKFYGLLYCKKEGHCKKGYKWDFGLFSETSPEYNFANDTIGLLENIKYRFGTHETLVF